MYAGAWMLFNRPNWDKWGQLTDRLSRTEPPQLINTTCDGMSMEYARTCRRATSSVGFGAGRRLERRVDLGGRRKMMDIGGGSGTYSSVAARANPQLHAAVCDLPQVVEVTREFIAEHGMGERVMARACDLGLRLHPRSLPQGCNVAVMASNLPQYSRDIIRGVIAKAHAALLPGGERHLIGEMLDDDRRGPADAAMWALNEVLGNSTGLAHTRADCAGYFAEAGFRNVTVDEFVPGVLVRMTGLKG